MLIIMLMLAILLTGPASAQTPGPPVPTPVPNPFGIPTRPTRVPLQIPTIAPTVVQPVLDSIATIQAQAESISSTVGLSYTLPTTLTLSGGNPFAMARGFAYMMGEVDWLQNLFVFFSAYLTVTIAVTMIRLIVSVWGVVRRLIEVIRLIIPTK
jgi:hypothetical protein